MTQERIQSGGQDNGYTSEPMQELSDLCNPGVTDNQVRILHGANEELFPVAGQTVGDVRRKLKDYLNLPEECDAMVGDDKVDDDFVLTSETSLEFNKATGTKGSFERPLHRIEKFAVTDPQTYEFVTSLVMEFAKYMFSQRDPEVLAMGLEKTFETIISLLDDGIFKLRFNEDTDDYMLCKYDPQQKDYLPIEAFSL